MTIPTVLKSRKTWVLILLFLLVVPNIFVTASTQKSRGGDFRGFLIAGERFIDGAFLYEGSSVATNVTWPPFFALFIAPFTMLAKINLPMTQVLWYLLNTCMFFAAIGIWCGILYRKKFGWFDGSKEPSLYSPPVAIPVLLAAGPFIDNVLALQISTMLLFLMTLGTNDLQENRALRAGFWFGCAAAIKAFPVLIILWLVYRRETKAALSMTLTGCVLTALPALRYGAGGYVELMRTWLKLSVTGGYPLGGLNQSFYAMVGRWVALNPFEGMIHRLTSPPLDDPGVIAATWIYRLSFALVIGLFVWMLRKKSYRSVGVEAAFFIILMTVFSPISWRHYYVLMVPAWMILAIWWLEKKDTVLQWVTISSGILITILYIIGTIGKPVRGFLLCVTSNFTIGALVIIAGLLYCVWKGYGNQTGIESCPTRDTRNAS